LKFNHTVFFNARRIINGTDRASLIQGVALDFQAILNTATVKV
jgi:hypothetical protein